MADAVSIANRALLQIGARATIASFTENSTESNAVGILFTPTFEALARSAHWNCLRQQTNLSVLAAAPGTPENRTGSALPVPPSPWQYSYAQPVDCLAVRFLLPTFPVSGALDVPMTTINNGAATYAPVGCEIPFAVAYSRDRQNNGQQVILTNQGAAQAVYTVNEPNPGVWDSQFQAAMVASLAAYLVPALNLMLPLMNNAIKSAEMAIAQARLTDGREGLTVMDHQPDWIAARGGAGRSYGVTGWTWGGLQNMAWPG